MVNLVKKEILKSIDYINLERGRAVTVEEIREYAMLRIFIGAINQRALDANLRKYCKQGLLEREGGGYRYDPYRYSVTDKGQQRWRFLELKASDPKIEKLKAEHNKDRELGLLALRRHPLRPRKFFGLAPKIPYRKRIKETGIQYKVRFVAKKGNKISPSSEGLMKNVGKTVDDILPDPNSTGKTVDDILPDPVRPEKKKHYW